MPMPYSIWNDDMTVNTDTPSYCAATTFRHHIKTDKPYGPKWLRYQAESETGVRSGTRRFWIHICGLETNTAVSTPSFLLWKMNEKQNWSGGGPYDYYKTNVVK
jgi:hypothetical protein